MEKNKMDKILEWLEIPFVASILKGAFVALFVIMGMLALATLVLAFYSPWWLIGFVLTSLIAGASFGVAMYLIDEY